MGEAKRRRKLTQQVLERFGFCIYCGGSSIATTADHVPPRAVFNLRGRPNGLEFPACDECNRASRVDEQVVAMFSRVYPDAASVAERDELSSLIRAVRNNSPEIIDELKPSFRQNKIARQSGVNSLGGGVLNCRGPRLNRAILSFAGKMGYALHFHLLGKPVSPAGAASVWWLTNYQAMKGEVPEHLQSLLGAPETLRQGRWEVSNQFQYASVGAVEGTMSAHFASFRYSFAICAFVSENHVDVTPPKGVGHVSVFRPGWLKL